jgi:hypothetical protein
MGGCSAETAGVQPARMRGSLRKDLPVLTSAWRVLHLPAVAQRTPAPRRLPAPAAPSVAA